MRSRELLLKNSSLWPETRFACINLNFQAHFHFICTCGACTKIPTLLFNSSTCTLLIEIVEKLFINDAESVGDVISLNTNDIHSLPKADTTHVLFILVQFQTLQDSTLQDSHTFRSEQWCDKSWECNCHSEGNQHIHSLSIVWKCMAIHQQAAWQVLGLN